MTLGETVSEELKAPIERVPPVGAVESDWAVKLVPAPVLPALSCAVTEPDWVPAEPLKV